MKRVPSILLLGLLCLPVAFEGCKPKSDEPVSPGNPTVSTEKDSSFFNTVYIGCTEPGGKKGIALLYFRQDKVKGQFQPIDILGADYMRFTYTTYDEIFAALQIGHSAVIRQDPVVEKYKDPSGFWEDMFKSKSGFVKRQSLTKEQAITLVDQKKILLAGLPNQSARHSWANRLASVLTAIVTPAQAQAIGLATPEVSWGHVVVGVTIGAGAVLGRATIINAVVLAGVPLAPLVAGVLVVSTAAVGAYIVFGAIREAQQGAVQIPAENAAGAIGRVFSGGSTGGSSSSHRAAGGTRADPMIAGLDGAQKFLHPAGEFWAIHAKNDEFAAQVRFEMVGPIERARASTTTSLAIRTGKDVVSFTVKPFKIHVNGQEIKTDFDTQLLQDRAFLTRTAINRYALTTTYGDLIEVRVNPNFNIYWYVRVLNEKRRNQVEGLLGQYNGNPDDDFQDKSGKVYSGYKAPAKEWYGTFINDWRILQSESILVYPTGKTTESYTFRDFPSQPLSLFDFDVAARNNAEQVCRKAGIMQEPDLSDCMADVLVTGLPEMADQQALGIRLKLEKAALFGRQSEFPGQPRTGAITLAVGNRIFAGLGSGQSDWYEYNSTTDTWTKRGDFAGSTKGIYDTAPFVIGQKIYLAGGVNGADGKAVSWLWEYDVQTDTWAKRKDVPGTARFNMAGFAAGGKGYIVFGATGWGTLETDYPEKSATYQYDPATDVWTKQADFPAKPRGNNVNNLGYNGTVLTIDGRSFVGGGTGSGTIWKDWFEYRPATNTWEKRATGSNSDYFQFSIGNIGYRFTQGSSYLAIYDAITDKWTEQTDVYFPGSSVDGATKWPAVVNGRAYFGLGKGTGGLTNEWWSFAPGR
ncbi:VWD domain-containing protein [Spirosoma areae]